MSMPGLSTLRPSNRAGYVLESNAVSLVIRQQPECALLTQENKEKGRKPIDPPPIVQMMVDRNCDPQEQWIVSPYLFMIAVILEGEEGDAFLPNKFLVGQTSSSLHRLKDVDNKDGGFFVFGDISVRKAGKHRLQFNLFDTDKDTGDAMLLKTIESEVFEVVSNKEFRGLTESTHLSRTFSDQGVRLRLRKEPRTIQGHVTLCDPRSSVVLTASRRSGGVKRSYGSPEQTSPVARTAATSYGGPVHDQTYSTYPSTKRQRADTDYAHTASSSYYQDPQPSFYGSNTLSSNAPSATGRWGDQMAKSSVPLGYSLAGRPQSSYSMGGSSSHLARAYPNLSQPVSQLSSVGYGSRGTYFEDGYPQQTTQYFSQAQTDPYGSLPGLHTSGSIADSSSLASSSRPGTQGYLAAGGEFAVQAGAVNPPHPASQGAQYAIDVSGTTYATGRSGTASVDPPQAYASTPTAAGLSYDQSSQAGLGASLYSQSGASSVQNPYATGMSRAQYPVHSSGVSHTGVPEELFNSTLNSTWPGAYTDQEHPPITGTGTSMANPSVGAPRTSRYQAPTGKQQWQ